MRNKIFSALALLGLAWATPSYATCSGSGLTWSCTAGSTNAQVQTAVNSASSGATITLANGSYSWSGRVSLISKAVTVTGSGSTVITCSQCFYLSQNTTADVAIRVTNMTLATNSSGPTFALDSDGGGEAPRGFRIDHITRTNNSGSIIEFANGWGRSSSSWQGLMDHNTIHNGRIVLYGEEGSTAGRYRWAENDDLGTVKALYVEHNTFVTTSSSLSNSLNQIDGNWGSRMVVRFNTFTNSRVEQHGVQGQNGRAVRIFEIYNNTFTAASPGMFRFFFLRGGTGLAFHNTTDGNDSVGAISIDNARSHQWSTDSQFNSQLGAWGGCTGSSPADNNESGGEGYVCIDQFGASKDASLWSYSGQSPTHTKIPTYFFKNTRTDTGQDMGVEISCVGTAATCTRQSTKHIVQNRDWFTYTASFNGTSGVGEGTLANRPATCTTGVGYWATDQGSWNASGADGRLYRCTSTNTWALYYTPYTYPHPLQGGAPAVLPNPPTDVTLTWLDRLISKLF